MIWWSGGLVRGCLAWIRAYQKEVDALTKRAKLSEATFLELYKWLREVCVSCQMGVQGSDGIGFGGVLRTSAFLSFLCATVQVHK